MSQRETGREAHINHLTPQTNTDLASVGQVRRALEADAEAVYWLAGGSISLHNRRHLVYA